MNRPRRSNAARISATASRSPDDRGERGALAHVGHVRGLVRLQVDGGAVKSAGPIIQPTRQPVIA